MDWKETLRAAVAATVLVLCTMPSAGMAQSDSSGWSGATEQPGREEIAARIDSLFAHWDRSDSPGAAVAVVRNGSIEFKKGYGSAQLEYGIPIEPTTVFHVASVSKQFTAMSVLLLADRGELSLEDDIRDYLPEVPDFGRTITIRHLLNHTSGMRDQWELLAMGGWRLDDVITRDHILTMVRHQKELNFEPGDRYLYCNTGYTLAGEIVTRVSGKPLREFARENIFEPLGMSRTHFHDDHQLIVPGRSYSYSQNSEGFQKSVLSYANVGATSLFTTVEDLVLWLENFKTGHVGGKKLLEEMLVQGILNSGEEISYALGIGHGTYKGLATISHSGADAGFRSIVLRFPDQDFGVVVLSNLANFNPSGLAFKIVDLYLAEAIERAESDPAFRQPTPLPRSVAKVAPETFEGYVGQYRLDPAFLITITRDEDRLMASWPGQPRVQLFPATEVRYFLKENDTQIVFYRDTRSRATRLTFQLKEGDRKVAQRIDPLPERHGQLSDYTGVYHSDELGTAYELVESEAGLIARHRRHGDIPLAWNFGERFSSDRWFFRFVRFDRSEAGEVTGFRLSGSRVLDLRFERTVAGPSGPDSP
jgi:CubicO group peptidase (beta-lactamase class C family)